MEGFSHIWSAEMRRFLLSPVLRGTAHGLARSLARCGVARLIARPAWTVMASARVAPCFSSAGLTATARHDPVPTDQNWHVLHQGTFLYAQLAGRARRHEHDLSTPRKRAARRRMHAFHLVRAPSGHAQPEQCSLLSSLFFSRCAKATASRGGQGVRWLMFEGKGLASGMARREQ